MPDCGLRTDELARPSGFSHAVRATGAMVHLAGQTALDSAGVIVGSGVVEQFERALGNLLVALRAAGGEPTQRVEGDRREVWQPVVGAQIDKLASLTIYVVDMDDYRAHAARWALRVRVSA